jgi:hypothetical protein
MRLMTRWYTENNGEFFDDSGGVCSHALSGLGPFYDETQGGARKASLCSGLACVRPLAEGSFALAPAPLDEEEDQPAAPLGFEGKVVRTPRHA